MPFRIRKQGNRYCVFNSNTGKRRGCAPTRARAERFRRALEANVKDFEASFVPNSEFNLETELNNMEAALLEHGPALVGVAMTNTPHLRFRDQEITIVEEEDDELLRIPILRTGIFRHKGGKLRFTPKVLQKIVENHEAGVTDFAPSLNLHHKRGQALAWFHADRGGRLAVEGNVLVGYGKPTTPETIDYVRNGLYAYASAEFVPDYKSNVEQISMEALDEISSKEILEEMELQYTEKDGTFVFSQEQFDQVEQMIADLEQAQTKVTELETAAGDATEADKANTKKIAKLEKDLNDANAKITELEAGDEGDEGPEVPEIVRVQLEEQAAEIKRLKEAGLKTQINGIISEASRPVDGYAHPAYLLEFARNVLFGQPVGEGDAIVKLESSDAGGYARYLQQSVVHLLKNLPRTVKQDPDTENNDNRPGDSGDEGNQFDLEGEYTEEDMKNAAEYIWGLVD